MSSAEGAQVQGDPIRQQIDELDKEFRSLVGLAHDAVLQQGLEPSVFQERVSRLNPDLRAEHNTFIKDLFMPLPRPATIADIWTKLNLYWSYLNYSLLGHIIEEFGNQKLKQRFKTFVDRLASFKSSTKLCDFVHSCRHRHRHLPEADNLKKLEVKTDRPDWSTCTLKQVEDYMWEIISNFFDKEEFKAFFKEATEGCVCITWLVTPSAASKIRCGLDDIPSKLFKEMGIQVITVDGYSKYASKEEAPSKDQLSIAGSGQDAVMPQHTSVMVAGARAQSAPPQGNYLFDHALGTFCCVVGSRLYIYLCDPLWINHPFTAFSSFEKNSYKVFE